jgi:N-acetylneuraminic acid mutarotase
VGHDAGVRGADGPSVVAVDDVAGSAGDDRLDGSRNVVFSYFRVFVIVMLRDERCSIVTSWSSHSLSSIHNRGDQAARTLRSRPGAGTGRSIGMRFATTLFSSALLALAAPALGGEPPQACAGDCDGNRRVVIDELLTGIGIVFGQRELEECEAFDKDQDLQVGIEELVAGAGALLRGCPGVPPPPTRTPTATVTAGTPSPTATENPDRTPAWESLAPLPAPRQESGVAELDGRVYVLGGFDVRGPVNTVEVYDPASDEWTGVAPLPQALHHVAAAAVGGRVYAIGGLLTLAFTAVNNVYAYDPAADMWQPRAGLPAARGAAAAAVIGGRIYVAGGYRGGRSVDDFAVYDPMRNEWTDLPRMPTARDHLTAGAIGGIFYAAGGRAGALFDALEAFDPVTGEWETLAPMPTARAGLAGAVFGGRLYTFGGEGNRQDPQGIFPQTEAYDPLNDEWQALPDMPVPRHGMGAAAVGNRIFVPGGATRQGFLASDANEALRP